MNAGCYAGHSRRIGAATTAAARGLEDSTIQMLCRWKSLAYLEYIRIPYPLMVVLWSHPCISILCLLSLGLDGPPFLWVGCGRMGAMVVLSFGGIKGVFPHPIN